MVRDSSEGSTFSYLCKDWLNITPIRVSIPRDLMSKSNNYIELEKEFLEAVAALIRERPELGYRDPEDFINDAVRHYLLEIPKNRTQSAGP